MLGIAAQAKAHVRNSCLLPMHSSVSQVTYLPSPHLEDSPNWHTIFRQAGKKMGASGITGGGPAVQAPESKACMNEGAA